ncbi:TPA: DUF969 domain-containing protein, partial [Streptococcus pyogenes]|nr:DUF969 domain-containing protein [Streptococcus pyogenes]
QLGYDGNQAKIAFSSILIAIISIIIVAIYNYLFEKKMERQHQKGDN